MSARAALALALALAIAGACGDDDGTAGGDAGRDGGADGGATPACTVECSTIMPGEHRADCVTAEGTLCPDAFPVCDPETVPEGERDRLFLTPRCLEAPAGAPPRAFCGLIGEEPAYADPAIVRCRPTR